MSIYKQSTAIETANATVYLTGLFLYGEEKAGDDSVRAFMKDFDEGRANFDLCAGSYRVRIVYPDRGDIYFGDNSGVLFWYFDAPSGQVLEQLSEVPVERRKADMVSVAQFLWFGCIYGTGTTIEGITRSDPENYYILQDGKFISRSKGLTPLERLAGGDDALELYMCRVLKAVGDDAVIGCSITAGTDSRSVLAHLYANGVHPLLSITGTDEHLDVQTARKIAAALGEELVVISGVPDERSWITSAAEAVDGQAGVCGAYRLLKQFQALNDRGVTLQFGGGAGEFYKNSFINQDYPIYGGSPNWKHFLKMKVITYDFPEAICGSKFLSEIRQTPERLLQMVSAHHGATKASAYLSAGYRILQSRAATLSMMENRQVITCNPLMERTVAAPMFRANPYRLEMQAYQRNQVAAFCPSIMDIPTDRGLTLNPAKMRSEQMKSMLYLLHVAAGRLVHRKQVAGRVDACFAEGLSSPQYHAAVRRCKDLGILAPEVQKIPYSIADRVFALGTIL